MRVPLLLKVIVFNILVINHNRIRKGFKEHSIIEKGLMTCTLVKWIFTSTSVP